jgi:outer membrane protein TolC
MDPSEPGVDGARGDHFEDRQGARLAVTFAQAIAGAEASPGVPERRDGVTRRARLDRLVGGSVSGWQLMFQPGVRALPEANQTFAIQGTLMKSWSLVKLRAARREAARGEREAFAAQIDALVLDRRLEAARLWIELHVAQTQLELARKDVELATSLARGVEEATGAGVLLAADLAEADAYVAEASARELEARGRAHDLGLDLSRAMGADPWSTASATGALPSPPLPALSEISELYRGLDALPAARAARLQTRAARARIVEERRFQRGSQITAGTQIDRDDPRGLLIYGIVGFTIPDRSYGRREEGQLALDASAATAASAELAHALRSALARNLHELAHVAVVVERLDTNLLPALRRAVTARDEARAAGEGTVFEALAARRRLIAAEIERERLHGELTWVRVEAWLYLDAIATGANDQ